MVIQIFLSKLLGPEKIWFTKQKLTSYLLGTFDP